MPEQPASPLEGAIKGFWSSTKGVWSSATEAWAAATDATQGVNLTSSKKERVLHIEIPKRDVEAEFSRPFSTGSPLKMMKDVEDSAEFSDFAFWSVRPPPLTEDPGEDTYNDLNFWKPVQPTLAELERQPASPRSPLR